MDTVKIQRELQNILQEKTNHLRVCIETEEEMKNLLGRYILEDTEAENFVVTVILLKKNLVKTKEKIGSLDKQIATLRKKLSKETNDV